MGLTEPTGQLINPKTAAKEEDIPGAIELWEERCSRLARHGADYTLPAACKKVALKKILTGKVRETCELWEAENLSFDDPLKRTTDLARARQLDNDVAKGRPGVSMGPTVVNAPAWGGGNQEGGGQEDVNAMNQSNKKKWKKKGGKSKYKGKGDEKGTEKDQGKGAKGGGARPPSERWVFCLWRSPLGVRVPTQRPQ